MSIVRVIKWEVPQKILRLDDGQILTVSVSSCVGEGDELVLKDDIWKVLCHNGYSHLLPIYCISDRITCGDLNISIQVKEIETITEYQGFRHLSDFHYRGKSLHGRTSVLIAVTDIPLLPRVLGYVELATSFFMNKARRLIFDAPFQNEVVTWKSWDKSTASKYTNLIVRIARCVVYPEFRGLGLGQILIKHAFDFAHQHWQVGRWQPYFVEIVADMLKYVPLAERAGMTLIGFTEGNINRVARDMGYLYKNRNRVKRGEIVREDSVGIVDLQVSYLDRLVDILHQNNKTADDLPTLLNSAIEDKSPDDTALWQSVLRFPKPTYMKGLIPEAKEFLFERTTIKYQQGEYIINDNEALNSLFKPLSRSIVIDGLNIIYRSTVARTKKTRAIQQAFGISPNEVETTVLKDFGLVIPPKSIVLVCGASGSGKTSLMNLVAQRGMNSDENERVEYSGFLVPEEAIIGVFKPIQSDLPLIELIGQEDIRRSLHILNVAGLTEAFLYLKRYNELSHGQQYRTLIATMIDSRANLWIADEFCAALDEITANIVAYNLQKYSRELGATVVVGASHYRSFIRSLQPDIVVQLTTAWEFSIYKGEDFVKLLKVNKSQEVNK
jgi:ABC-type lipoprotein export system ATPase subunit/GNAT superfamily N-acetyltransferase